MGGRALRNVSCSVVSSWPYHLGKRPIVPRSMSNQHHHSPGPEQ